MSRCANGMSRSSSYARSFPAAPTKVMASRWRAWPGCQRRFSIEQKISCRIWNGQTALLRPNQRNAANGPANRGRRTRNRSWNYSRPEKSLAFAAIFWHSKRLCFYAEPQSTEAILMKALRILQVLALFASPVLAGTFTVTNTNDSGAGSLRQAILDANANPGTDTIAFSIPGSGGHMIRPQSPLPQISDSVVIDGYTQPGTSPNTLAIGDNAVLLVEI